MLLLLAISWPFLTSLVGLVYALIGKTTYAGSRDRVLCFVAKPGGLCARVFGLRYVAITFGNVQVYASYSSFADRRTRIHENRHTLQALVLGPLFLPVYGLCSLWAWLRGNDGYRDNALEQDAYAAEKVL